MHVGPHQCGIIIALPQCPRYSPALSGLVKFDCSALIDGSLGVLGQGRSAASAMFIREVRVPLYCIAELVSAAPFDQVGQC